MKNIIMFPLNSDQLYIFFFDFMTMSETVIPTKSVLPRLMFVCFLIISRVQLGGVY